VGRFLVLWRQNPQAPWPTNPAEALKLNERLWAGLDMQIQKGDIKEIGWFIDGSSGYIIGEGSSTTILGDIAMFSPYVIVDVHEVIDHEKAKETFRTVLKAQAEAIK
jgi:hypothetical protein